MFEHPHSLTSLFILIVGIIGICEHCAMWKYKKIRNIQPLKNRLIYSCSKKPLQSQPHQLTCYMSQHSMKLSIMSASYYTTKNKIQWIYSKFHTGRQICPLPVLLQNPQELSILHSKGFSILFTVYIPHIWRGYKFAAKNISAEHVTPL
jgi:hypothetical protein